MLKSYFRIALQNILKYKKVSTLNILGLSIAIAIAGYIYLLVQHELSYDNFHKDVTRIYRLNTKFKYPNSPERESALSSSPMGPFLASKSAAIESYLRLYINDESALYYYGDKKIGISRQIFTDTSFFRFFDFPLLEGTPTSVLQNANNVILSEEIAKKIFVNENPMGKIIEYKSKTWSGKDTSYTYTISGVFKKLPANTHLHFDMVGKMPSYLVGDIPGKDDQSWHGVQFYTYFKLRSALTDPAKTATSFPSLLKPAMNGYNFIELSLQSLRDVHLNSSQLEYDNLNENKFDSKYIWILSLAAIFILVIATINFTNISTILANKRLKEIALRKSFGASRSIIVKQFLVESLGVTLIAVVVGLLLLYAALPSLNNISGREINVNIDLLTWEIAILLITVITCIAGSYAALIVSRLPVINIFSSYRRSGSVKKPFIKGLVILQFSLSIILIISVLVIYNQFRFIQYYNVGYSTSQTIYLKTGNGHTGDYPQIKNELEHIPGVQAVTGADDLLGNITSQNGVYVRDPSTLKWTNFPMPRLFADYNFLTFYNMPLAKGRYFSPEAMKDGSEYIVNESFAKRTGIENPLGVVINSFSGDTGRIVGVVKDFNQATLHKAIEPLLIKASPREIYISVKFATADVSGIIKRMEKIWQAHITDLPFDYHFVDEYFRKLYEREDKLSRIIFATTGLAIFIACIGLFIMTSFITQQRSKEIGIRKVLGAGSVSVMRLLSGEFIKLVAVATLVSWPIAYFASNYWLTNFTERLPFNLWVYIGATLIVAVIGSFAISFQTVRASSGNPVDSLRSE